MKLSFRILGALFLALSAFGAQAQWALFNNAPSTQQTVSAGSQFLAPNGGTSAPSYSFTSDPDTGLYWISSGTFGLVSNASEALRFNGNLTLAATSTLRWGSTGVTAQDITFSRHAASALMMNNAVASATKSCVANTYTDASNWEALCMSWTSNIARLGTEAAGTGLNRVLSLATVGTIAFSGFTFANIGTNLTANGMIGYCSDCTTANPCAAAGTGALAKRLNGVNVCN